MGKAPYLVRRDARLAYEELKRQIIFGLVISAIAIVVGSSRYFLAVNANDTVALALAIFGGFGLALTVVVPSAWKSPENLLGRALRAVGAVIFKVFLMAVYVLMMSPIGWALRRYQGADPIYSWDQSPPKRMEGWQTKQVLYDAGLGRKGNPNALKRAINVLQFFANRGHFLFLPTLVLLIALGIVLFFVKSSALAPFIYTLF